MVIVVVGAFLITKIILASSSVDRCILSVIVIIIVVVVVIVIITVMFIPMIIVFHCLHC